MEVISVNWQFPTKNEVVEERECKGRGDAVVREHIRHHANLVVQRSIAPHEPTERDGDGTFVNPLVERVEDQLGATWRFKLSVLLSPNLQGSRLAIGILLPAIKLIVSSK